MREILTRVHRFSSVPEMIIFIDIKRFLIHTPTEPPWSTVNLMSKTSRSPPRTGRLDDLREEAAMAWATVKMARKRGETACVDDERMRSLLGDAETRTLRVYDGLKALSPRRR